MLTKDQVRDAMLRECDICVHLHSKLGPEAFAYRPSPAQRSTLELLRYLSVCATAALDCLVNADWKRFAGHSERAKEMGAADFPAAMERQKADIEAFFARTGEEALRTQEAPLPGGRGLMPLGAAILNGPFKWLAAYKLQLFLYAKANGAEIGTANAWAGMDLPPKV